MKNHYLTIKEFSQLTHTTVDTLKHYDKMGLLRPAYIGENKYRYYTAQQAFPLTRILFGVKACIPLSEIKEIIHDDAPDQSMVHYQKIYQQLENHIEELKAMQNAINNLVYYYDLTQKHPLDTLFNLYLPEWFIIYSPKLKLSHSYQTTEANIANKLFLQGFYNGFWPHYQLGAFFTPEDVAQNNFSETSYCLKVDYPEQYAKEELDFVSGGNYLCLLTKVGGRNLPNAVKEFLNLVRGQGKRLQGKIFALDVINNLITSNPENYCTMIFACEAQEGQNGY